MTPFGITLAGMEELIDDQRAAGVKPVGILVHEHDYNDLAEEVMAQAKHADPKEKPGEQVIMVRGVPVYKHPHATRGKAQLLHHISREVQAGVVIH